jgi:pimeloyl-ACP methyl ester carboxylesterase
MGIAWDVSDSGLPSGPPEVFCLYDYAEPLAGFIKQLGLDHPHVLGLSVDGELALVFHHHYSMILTTLILASAYAGWAGLPSPEILEERL